MKLPRYSKYKDSGVKWLGQVPEHWEVKALKYVATLNDDDLPEDTDPAYEINYVDIGSVSLERGIEKTEAMCFGEAPSRARRRVQSGDVIVSTVRTYLKAICPIGQPEENLIVSTGFAVVRPRRDMTPQFAHNALQSQTFIDEVISRSTGVSYPAINPSELQRIKISLPLSSEQELISGFLEQEIGKLDALVEQQQLLIEMLEEKRQVVISQVVTKGLNLDVPMKPSGVQWLGEVPAHWEVYRLATLYREINEAGNDGLPILSVSIHDGVSDRQLAEDELDRKVNRSEDSSKYKKVLPGDLVYNMMRAWQGGFGTVTVSGQISPAYVVARPKQDFSSRFIELLLRTPQAIEEIRCHSYGVTDFRLRLYWDNFKIIRVVLPPKDEQEKILARIEEMNQEFDQLIEASNSSIATLQERRSAIITAAVTGQIDVRNYRPQEAPAVCQ